MTLAIEQSLFLVRDLDPMGGPLCPDGWACFPHSGGWYRITSPDGNRLLAYRENDNGSAGLFALFGDIATLALIDASSAIAQPARWVWRHRADPGVSPYIRRWRTFRGSGQERIDGVGGAATPWTGVRTLGPVGTVLPATALPWNLDAEGNATTLALAVMRVESIDRPALLAEMAGSATPSSFEDEPDPGDE